MAAYNSGFDPPTRPGDRTGSRIPGLYAQTGSSSRRPEGRVAGIPDSRSVHTVGGKPQQTSLPRPSMRDTAPSTGQPPEPTGPHAGTASRFGFGKSSGRVDAAVPELRSKTSRNVLRRKPSLISEHAGGAQSAMERSGSTSPTKWTTSSTEQRPSIEASMRSIEAYNDIFTRTSAKAPAVRNNPRIIPELDRYGTRPEQLSGQSYRSHEVPKLATQDLPPPTPSSATAGTSGISGGSGGSGASGALWAPTYPVMNSNYNRYSGYSGYSGSGYSPSPSTRFSESPGPGAYSRDTTPTSMASQSPGIMAPSKTHTPRLRQGSPALTRLGPPVTRRRAGSTSTDGEGLTLDTQGLPSLQESVTSSSSNSTVKGSGKPRTPESSEKKKKKKGLSPLPPSPPPRKSSQKSSESPPTDTRLPPKPGKGHAQTVMTSPVEASVLDPPTVFSHQRSTSNSSNASNPPTRPSRQGIPSLQSQLGVSIPVIQSNLASLSPSQDKKGRRQSILSLTNTALGPKQSPYPSQTGSRFTSRDPSPAPAQFAAREVAPDLSGLGIIPDLRPVQTHPPTTRSSTTRTPSPTVSNPRQRFGLFSRRTKTAPAEIPTPGSKDKLPRKGPAAGTGHEGYGKYGHRGRSSSIVSGVSAGQNRSTSAASSAESVASSTRTHDPFLLDRMSPVIITGRGGMLENRNTSSELTRTESGTSLVLSTQSIESKGSSNLGQEVSRTTLWPSALPKESAKGTSSIGSKSRRPSDSSDDWMSQPSSLAFRRSMQRINHPTGELTLPRPLTLSNMGASPSLRSLESSLMESSIMSDESQIDANGEQVRGRKVLKAKPKKLEKRTKSPRKWNLFHRSQPKEEPQPQEAVAVTIGRQPVKAVPHYAMLDSSDELQDGEQVDLGEILRDADVTQLNDEEFEALQFNNYKENLKRIEDLQIQMDNQGPLSLPERSPMIFSSPEPMHSTPELEHAQPHIGNGSTPPSAPVEEASLNLTQDTAPVRPSRLPQVGRIPKVMSARPEATSPKSFSRPFARLSTLQPIPGPFAIDKDSVALGSGPLESFSLEHVGTEAGFEVPRGREDFKNSTSDSAHNRQLFTFSPRKDSEATTSSSGAISFAGTTAFIPPADAALEEDEVWDEYDDLIGITDATNPPLSATSSHGMPFQYEKYESRKMSESELQPKKAQVPQQTPTINGPSIEESATDLPIEDNVRSSQATTSSMHSVEMATRMKALLVTVPSPKAPMTFAETAPRQHDGNAAKKHKRKRSKNSPKKPGSSNHMGSGSTLVPVKEPDSSSPISQVNLRVGSMTVSKWLTFGHVLFSPAREDILNFEDSTNIPSILVIDGLGNGIFDLFTYYCTSLIHDR